MRAVEKGEAPRTYTKHEQAKNDLANRIGWYCSYCEMGVRHFIAVEHIVPQNNGGAILDWENFLLGCFHCNSVKGARNQSREGYLWPDIDNTPLAFAYNRTQVIHPAANLSETIYQRALATIHLTGLDRRPGGNNEPTDRDVRWIHRREVWGIAEASLEDWHLTSTPAMARQIARTAFGHGFYSIWMTIFQGIQPVINEINQIFPGTYLPLIDSNTHQAQIRTGGTF